MTDREQLIALLADYLLEHGVIVLPCKAGDTLYCESTIKVSIG